MINPPAVTVYRDETFFETKLQIFMKPRHDLCWRCVVNCDGITLADFDVVFVLVKIFKQANTASQQYWRYANSKFVNNACVLLVPQDPRRIC